MRTLTALAMVLVLVCWAQDLCAQEAGGFGGGGFGGAVGPVPAREPALRPTFSATVLRLRVPSSILEAHLAEGKSALSQEDVSELVAAGEVVQIMRAATPEGGVSCTRSTTYISGFTSVVSEYAVAWQPGTSECRSGSRLRLGRPEAAAKTRKNTDRIALSFEQEAVIALEEQVVQLPTQQTPIYRTDLVADTKDGPAAVNRVEVRAPDSSPALPELKLILPHTSADVAQYVGPVSKGEVVVVQRRTIDEAHDEIVLAWSESSDPFERAANPDASDVSFSVAVEAEALLVPLADFVASAALWSAAVDAGTVDSLRKRAKSVWCAGGVMSLAPGRERLEIERHTSTRFVSGFSALVAEAAVGWQPETSTAKGTSSLHVKLIGRTDAGEPMLHVFWFKLSENVVSKTADVPVPPGGASVQMGLPEETEWEVENVIVALPRGRTLVLVFGAPPAVPGETSPAERAALFLLTAR